MINKEDQNKVFDYIQKNAGYYVETLRELVKQPSVSTTGLGIQECSRMVKELIEKNNFHARIIEPIEDAPIIYADTKLLEKEKTLLFYSHYDVVPPEPLEQWICNPYEATIVGDKIVGRGVADTKSSIVADIVGVHAVREVLGELPINVKFLFEGEEEVASKNLCKYLKDKPAILKADAMLWEGSKIGANRKPIIYAGLKGSLFVEMCVKTAKIDQHSMWAPIVSNPAWELVWSLSSLKSNNGKILIDGFFDKVKEPSREDIAVLEKVSFDEAGNRKAFGIEEYLYGLSGLDLLKALIFDPTCTICGLDSGYTGESIRTINPRHAKTKLDFRLVPDQSCQEIFIKLREYLDKKGFSHIEINILRMAEPVRTKLNSRIVKTVSETSKEIFNEEPSIWPMIPGSATPISYFDVMGLPSVSGPCIAHLESNTHAPNENILIPNFISGIKHVASIIMNF